MCLEEFLICGRLPDRTRMLAWCPSGGLRSVKDGGFVRKTVCLAQTQAYKGLKMTTENTVTRSLGKPPFRADHVGSFLRPESVKKARKQLQDKEITPEVLRAVEDEAIMQLVEK